MPVWWIAFVLLFVSDIAFPQSIIIEDLAAPDFEDRPLRIRIWFPEVIREPAGAKTLFPLIIMSHGAGGSHTGHSDTATALAEAGMVVVSVLHTGDNYRDESYVQSGRQLYDRTRHISRVLDFMLSDWPQKRRVDVERIGAFGFSAGGFTTLVLAGGEPDLAKTVDYCQSRPKAWSCLYLQRQGYDFNNPPIESLPFRWTRDSRIKSAVVAAPAIGYAFAPTGLAAVTIPIQLWQAEFDLVVDDSPSVVKALLPSSPDFHLVSGAGHVDFLESCDWKMDVAITVMRWFGTMDICAKLPGFDRRAFHDRFNSEVVQFFARSLHLDDPASSD